MDSRIPRLSRRALLAWLAAAALPLPAAAPAPPFRAQAEDFDAFWHGIDQGYAYFDGAGRIAWKRARERWRPAAMKAATPEAFAACLARAAAVLCDDHVMLSADPERRVPSETDLWAAWHGNDAVLEAVRTYGEGDVAGLRPGQVVTAVDGVAIERVVRERLLHGARPSGASRDWALRHVLAGPRQGTLRIEVGEGKRRRTVEVERRAAPRANGPLVIGRRMGDERDLGYVRVRPGLQDPGVMAQFEAAMAAVRDTRALMLDLRDVNGEGGRDHTRAILARFVPGPTAWQVREPRGRERATDTVAPEGAGGYRAPLVALVDRWTAGEGEALAAGLHAAGARLVGTRMAGLRGELAHLTLAHSGLVASYPAQRVFHVDGTPRESLRPAVEVDLAAPSGGPGDPILYQALKLAAQLAKNPPG